MSSGVLKWYGSLMIALFRLVGFKQMCSFRLPNLSLLSTSTKLLIQGVASCTGLSTPACSILSTSCLNASLRWTGIRQQGVCLGVTLGSIYIWKTWEATNPFKDIRVFMQNLFLLVTSLGTAYFCLGIWAATSCVGLWVDTSCFCTHNVDLVFLGCLAELVSSKPWVANSPILFLVVSIQASKLFYKIITCCRHSQLQRMSHPSISWYQGGLSKCTRANNCNSVRGINPNL